MGVSPPRWSKWKDVTQRCGLALLTDRPARLACNYRLGCTHGNVVLSHPRWVRDATLSNRLRQLVQGCEMESCQASVRD
jgi:hypothetical protein